MESISRLVVSFLLNAAWQVTLVFLLALLLARLLRVAPARYLHGFWVMTLGVCLVLPAVSLVSLRPQRAVPPIRVEIPAPRVTQAPAVVSTPAQFSPEAAALAATPLVRSSRLADFRRLIAQPIPCAPVLARAIVLGYGLFLLFVVARFCWAWRTKNAVLRGARALPASPQFERIVTETQRAFGVNNVRIVWSPQAPSPLTVGIRRPIIVLPECLPGEQPEQVLTAVLAHEMVHIKRRDFFFNLACELLLLPISFHPAALALRSRIARTREQACDEIVAGRSVEPPIYAQALLDLARLFSPVRAPRYSVGACDTDVLEERIMRIMKLRNLHGSRRTRLLLVSACLAVLTLGLAASAVPLRIEQAAARIGLLPSHLAAPAANLGGGQPGTSPPVAGQAAANDSSEPSSVPQASQQEAAPAERISVVGRVLDSNNQPIVGAKVTLRVFAPMKPGTIVSVVSPRPTLESPTAQTDANGRFEFTVHNRGGMQVTAEAPGYVAPDPRISATAGKSSSFFEFPADKNVFTFDVVLLKSGTLEGILVDAESEKPITGVTVGAALRTFARGEALFMGQVGAVAPDPGGRFLIKGVPPGDYVLRIDSAPKISIEPQARSQEAQLPEAATLGYGQFYWPAMEPVPQPWNTFKLLSGADLNLGKIRIKRQPLHTVLASAREFTCKDGDTLSVALSRITPYSTNTLASERIPCGDFRLSNVPQGSYRLELMRWSSETAPQSRTVLEDASEPLDVRKNGRIQLVAQRPVSMTGIVAVEGTGEDDLPDNLKKCMVALMPVTRVPTAGSMPASLGPKGTFEIVQLFPANTYSILFGPLPAESYYVKQVTYNGSVLADPEMVPIVAGLPAHSLRILLSPRPASFDGRIDLGTRDDARGLTVVLVRDLGDTARRLRGLVKLPADQQGRVTRTGLPAAAFYAFALPTDSLAALERPGVLDGLLGAALRVNLNEGQTATVTVPLLKPPALEP